MKLSKYLFLSVLFFNIAGLAAEKPLGKVFKVTKKAIVITGPGIQKLKPGQKVFIQQEKAYVVAEIKSLFHSKAEAIVKNKKILIKPGQLVFLTKPVKEKIVKKNAGNELTPEYIRAHGIFKESLTAKPGKTYISPTDGRYVREIPEFPLIYHADCHTRDSAGKEITRSAAAADSKDVITKCRYWLNGLLTPEYDAVSTMAFSRDYRQYGYKARQANLWHMVVNGHKGPGYEWAGWLEFINKGDIQWYYFAYQGNKAYVVTNQYTREFAEIALVKIEGDNNWWTRDNSQDRPTFVSAHDIRILTKEKPGQPWQIFSLVNQKFDKKTFSDLKFIDSAIHNRNNSDRQRPYHACALLLTSRDNKKYSLAYDTGELTLLPDTTDTIISIRPSVAIPEILIMEVGNEKNKKASKYYLEYGKLNKTLGPYDNDDTVKHQYEHAQMIFFRSKSKNWAIGKNFELMAVDDVPENEYDSSPVKVKWAGKDFIYYGEKGNAFVSGKKVYDAKPHTLASIFIAKGQPVFVWAEISDRQNQLFDIFRNGTRIFEKSRLLEYMRNESLSTFHLLTPANELVEIEKGEIVARHKFTTAKIRENNSIANFCAPTDQGFICLFEKKIYGPFRGEYVLKNGYSGERVLCLRETPKSLFVCHNEKHQIVGKFDNARLIQDAKESENLSLIWAIKDNTPYAVGLCKSPAAFPRSYLDLDFLSDEDRAWVKGSIEFTELYISVAKNKYASGPEFREYHASSGESYAAAITKNCSYVRSSVAIDPTKPENENLAPVLPEYAETVDCMGGRKKLSGQWFREHHTDIEKNEDYAAGKLHWFVAENCDFTD